MTFNKAFTFSIRQKIELENTRSCNPWYFVMGRQSCLALSPKVVAKQHEPGKKGEGKALSLSHTRTQMQTNTLQNSVFHEVKRCVLFLLFCYFLSLFCRNVLSVVGIGNWYRFAFEIVCSFFSLQTVIGVLELKHFRFRHMVS